MYTLAILETLDIGPLTLPERIEAAVSARLYIAEYAEWGLPVPSWLSTLHREIGTRLNETKRELDVVEVAAAEERVLNRLPAPQRRAVIQDKIAALQEKLRQI